MRMLAWGLGTYLVVVAQAALLHETGGAGWPWLGVVWLLLVLELRSAPEAIALAGVLGVLTDGLSAHGLGIGVLAYVMAAAWLTRRRALRKTPHESLAMSGLAAAWLSLVPEIARRLAAGQPWGEPLLTDAALSTTTTVALALAVLSSLRCFSAGTRPAARQRAAEPVQNRWRMLTG